MKSLTTLLCVGCLLASGCTTLEKMGADRVSDISGWDVSACVGNFDVCYELFRDNQELITGGASTIDLLMQGLGR